ncbi:hypothetical protein EVAR_77380_1 [Eumeta japonica]|uniref:Uncharacterized protein n=1 Tax=Eumeta variegata TaxID=151549 RepID=A0A4C1UXB4_EUMVA|nr:hypothetical protein EVAR_77380_1 [Eumeta japonica]
MTYASPVFAHAAPNRLKKLQTLQNKFCRSATNAHWCVKNSVLRRDLDIPSIAKYMKDASERFFSIAETHSNPSFPRRSHTRRRSLIISSVGHGMYSLIRRTISQVKS